jgi:hypothetical protein
MEDLASLRLNSNVKTQWSAKIGRPCASSHYHCIRSNKFAA